MPELQTKTIMTPNGQMMRFQVDPSVDTSEIEAVQQSVKQQWKEPQPPAPARPTTTDQRPPVSGPQSAGGSQPSAVNPLTETYPALGDKIEGFVGIDRYVPVFEPPLNTPYLHAFYDEAVERLKKAGLENAAPDRYVQSNFEAMNALKLGIEKSKFQGRADSEKLIAALEGLEMKESADFPTGDKLLRKEDHQAFVRETIFEMREGKYHLLDTIPWQKSEVPPACTFA